MEARSRTHRRFQKRVDEAQLTAAELRHFTAILHFRELIGNVFPVASVSSPYGSPLSIKQAVLAAVFGSRVTASLSGNFLPVWLDESHDGASTASIANWPPRGAGSRERGRVW